MDHCRDTQPRNKKTRPTRGREVTRPWATGEEEIAGAYSPPAGAMKKKSRRHEDAGKKRGSHPLREVRVERAAGIEPAWPAWKAGA